MGLTRWLLRRGAKAGGFAALGYGLADLAAAAVLFVALGVALVGFVDFLSGLAAAPVLDLAELFRSIRDEPGAYWWLYFAFFTTLVPTLLHLVLGLLSGILAFRLSRPVRWVRGWLPRVEEDANAWMGSFLVLTTAGLMAIIIAYFALYGLVQLILSVHPSVGWSYLWLFEWYACWLGAPVTPGPLF